MTFVGFALGAGRAAAGALHVDVCRISRPTGAPGPINPDTGERDPAPTVDVYGPDIAPHRGACKIQTYEPHESTRRVGAHQYTEQRYHLHLPHDAPDVRVGDTVTVVSSLYSSVLAGRTYRIAGTHAKSMSTARRLLLDEITG